MIFIDENNKEHTLEEVLELEKIRKSKRLSIYDKNSKVIKVYYNDKPGFWYEVDMERCSSPSAALNWIHQLSEKTWCKGKVFEDFVEVLFENIPVEWWSWKL